MRIAFYPQSLVPFHGRSLEERPLGGTETGAIRLAQSLHKLGCKVVVFTSEQNPPTTEPPYYHLSKASGLKGVDAFVCIREWIPLVYQIPTRKKFLWTGDSYDQPFNFGLGDKRVAKIIDGLLTVSDWHSESMSEASGFPREKCYAIRNGIHLPFFSESPAKVPGRLIYASTPYRGLEHLVRLFPKIREKQPHAELHVFSGFQVYGGRSNFQSEMEEKYKPLMEALQAIEGVVLRGNVLQKELAHEMLQAEVMAYPNTFEETSCIVAMEAQAARCVPVVTKKGALPETVGDAGVAIEGEPGEADYDQAFVSEVCRVLDDEAYRKKLQERGRERAEESLSWDRVAERFLQYLRDVHKL